jgi:drug/metabolite transporter (DMT)-like permease
MLLAYLALALSMALVGANVVIMKLLSASLPVFVVLCLRCTLAAAVLAPFAGLKALPSPRAFANLGLQGLFGTLLYNAAVLSGLRLTGALQAGLVLATLPAVIAIGAVVFLRERLTPRQWAAVALAVIGIAAISHARLAGGSLAGDALVFAGVCGEAGYMLLARRISGRVPLVQAVFFMQMASAILSLPMAIATWHAAHFTLGISLLLVLHSLTASVLAMLLWYFGLKHITAGRAGLFTVFLPATATLLAILVLHEAFHRADLWGLLLMGASMLLAASRHKANRTRENA